MEIIDVEATCLHEADLKITTDDLGIVVNASKEMHPMSDTMIPPVLVSKDIMSSTVI